MDHLNIEIKARCENPQKIRNILAKLGADYWGIDHQIDTYFKVPNGRLKLREGNIENHLIFYERKDDAGPKASEVSLYEPRSGSEPDLREILKNALEVLVVVDKKRHIYKFENVKFHVDQVKDLGSFVEIEVLDDFGTIPKPEMQKQCEHYMKLFKTEEKDLINCSYSDMLLKK
jgi:adenylate cyclase, class 2